MSTVQARDVESGMLLDRLDHTTVGRPAYVRSAVVGAHPARGIHTEDGEPWVHITWSTGAKGVYAPHQRFIVAVPPA